MFDILNSLTKAALNTVALPVAAVRDVAVEVTEPLRVHPNRDGSHVIKRLDKIKEKLEEALD